MIFIYLERNSQKSEKMGAEFRALSLFGILKSAKIRI